MLQLPSWLPQTKFQPPRLRDDLAVLPRLLGLLNDAAEGSVILVSAPAGYGKTTLVTSWLRTGEKPNANAAHLPCAWLSLDAEDDEPHTFLAGLMGALQRLNPSCGASLRALLNEPASMSIALQHSIGMLINDIIDSLPEPFVLVLDDLHSISDPAIFAALDYLVEHQPEQMRLIIITREDPPLSLARLRARRRLIEVRLPELRFTIDEVTRLLNNRLEMGLRTDEIRALATHTEGWVAGLRLSAGALAARSPEERAAVIEHLAQGSRHIFELLAAEVLDRQSPSIRRFLLATSILDTLTPETCAAVLDDADAAFLLREMYRRNLFLIATDSRDSVDTTYRYHALFAAFLRRQLASECPADLPLLHCRAARVLNPIQAIQHYLAAGAFEEAATTIEQVAGDYFAYGQLGRLRAWIEALPTNLYASHPWLAYYGGAVAWGQSRLVAAQPYLETALAGFSANGDAVGQGETLVLLGTVHQTNGAFEPAQALFERARLLPISSRSKAQLHMGLAWLGLSTNDETQIGENLSAALDHVERTGDAGALQIVVMQLRELFSTLPAGRRAMERLCQLSDANRGDVPTPLTASTNSLRAVLCLWQGQYDAALHHTDRAFEQSAQLGDPGWLCNSLDFYGALVYEVAGRRSAADHALTRLRNTLDELPGWYSARAFAIGSILLNRGDVIAARSVATDMEAHGSAVGWSVSISARYLLRGLLALYDRQFAQAEQALLAAQAIQTSYSMSAILGDVDLVLATLYIRSRRPARARPIVEQALRRWRVTELPGLHLLLGTRLLESVLEYASANGIETTWVERVRSLHFTAMTPSPVVIPETGSTLTLRELEVLRLLADGASNQTIAETLVISLPTTKTHVARILAKLQVTTRTRAAARARELGLI